MIRHARMRGHPTLFLPGLDHACIAAQFVLDGILAKEGESRQTLGRERYLERMRAFSESTKPMMLGQQRRVGGSLDWGRLRYTMDEGSAKAVRVAFERLYRDGLAYRTEALVNWCPGCRTSVSDLEVIPTPETGTLWSVRYHLIDEATGEPDPGRDDHRRHDPARDDPRRHRGGRPSRRRALPRALVGRRVRIPFVERDVPIIADDVVDRAFGTGAVKITPAHDHDDYADRPAPRPACADDPRRRRDGHEHRDARSTASTATRPAAGSWPTSRRAATSSMSAPHEMVIGRCQRSNDVLEPRLKTQWFIRTEPLADPRARGDPRRADADPARAVREDLGALADEHPRLERVAASCGGATASRPGTARTATSRCRPIRDGPDACEVCGRPAAELQQDPDIFDTWFSSGLWPFSTLGWPDDTPDLRRYYPTSVMETGYDIIFFWVARMMMLGLQLTDREPFHTVYLSGLIRDPDGQKMSKTKGNVVDPLGVIDESGADALRFAAHPRRDARAGPAVRADQARERPQLRQQALERDALRRRGAPGDDRRRAPSGACPTTRAPRPGRALDPVARRGHRRGGRRARWPATPSAR